MASLFADARRAGRRPQTTASRTPLLAVLGAKPDGLAATQLGGRPVDFGGTGGSAPGLTMAGDNPLLAALRSAGNSEMTASAARLKSPTALQRRAKRQAALIAAGQDPDIRHHTEAEVDFMRHGGLVGGAERGPQYNADAPQISAGAKLANIRWHGHPDGPVDLSASLGQVNALRQAALRNGRRPGGLLASRG